MSLVVFEDVTLFLGGKQIVDDLSLRLTEGERAGLIGPNGSGKTSLFRLIAGEHVVDAGELRISKSMKLGYLPQDIALEGGKALLPFVRESVPGKAELDRALEEGEAAMREAEGRGDEEELLRIAGTLSSIHERIGHFELHYSEHQAQAILSGLGFQESDFTRDLGEFSGGWKMRAVLASLLYQRPDLLLLDEPTNHLDLPSVTWFSDFLKRYERAFVLICHDREFMNEQIERVISFEPEGVRSYVGNYDQYERQRAEEEEVLEGRRRNQERERERMESFIRRFRAKATKAAAVQSRVKALEKMEDLGVSTKRRVMQFTFPPSSRTGKVVLEVEGLSKSYGDHQVLNNVELNVQPGERIGIIGVNGAGKTTLLRVLAGELPSSGGEYKWGHNTKVGYYAQHHTESLNPKQTVLEAVAERDKEGNRTRVRGILGALLMGEKDVDKKISVLSGGERARVALARLLIDPGNVLVMDEPTNHLDLQSSESLADSLSRYDGTVLFVSHNRGFLRKVANRIWNVEDGTVEVYPGDLAEYEHSKLVREGGAASSDSKGGAKAGAKRNAKGQIAKPKVRETREQQKKRKRQEAQFRNARTKKLKPMIRKVEQLEQRVAKLEAKKTELEAKLADPAIYEDASKRDELLGEFNQTKQDLERKEAEWIVAQELLDDAEQKLKAEMT